MCRMYVFCMFCNKGEIFRGKYIYGEVFCLNLVLDKLCKGLKIFYSVCSFFEIIVLFLWKDIFIESIN